MNSSRTFMFCDVNVSCPIGIPFGADTSYISSHTLADLPSPMAHPQLDTPFYLLTDFSTHDTCYLTSCRKTCMYPCNILTTGYGIVVSPVVEPISRAAWRANFPDSSAILYHSFLAALSLGSIQDVYRSITPRRTRS